MVRFGWATFLLSMLVLAGCGGASGPKTVRVSGSVFLDGRPLENAEVFFVSEKHAGFGKTDSEGKFRLISGAVAGENKVYFNKIKEGAFGSGDAESGLDAGQAEAAALSSGNPGQPFVVEGQVIPPEYASAQATRLKFTVPPGGTDSAVFELETPK